MSFYRSDDVSFFKLVLPRENAWDIMNKLGQKPLLHIVPSKSPVLARPFLSYVRRCEEALHHLQGLESLLQQKGVYARRSSFPQAAYFQIFRLWDEQYAKSGGHPASVLNDVLGQVDHSWSYHQDLVKRAEVLSNKLQAYRDNLALLLGGESNFGKQFFTVRSTAQNMGRDLVGGSKISYKCGVIKIEEELRFKRTVFRITKGNSLVHCIPFSKIFTNLLPAQQTRVTFYILYPGGNDSYLEKKLSKLVENFCQSQYELPTNQQQFSLISQNVESGLVETENLLNLTQVELTDFLARLADPMTQSEYFRRHEYLKLFILKQKDLYNTLNQMDMYSNFLQGSVYVRTEDVPELQRTMSEIQEQTKHPAGQLVPSNTDSFPTHFVTNDFTRSAQEIVQTYGVANYKEANPAFFTCITFPFLFGVMFGDIGHGLIVFAFSIILIFFVSEDTNNAVFKMIRPHRYIICLMGFFATYCGFIYNDYLSISLNIFGSCFDVAGVQQKSPIPRNGDCVYPFGLDPVWSVAENNLNFVNSLKMKISVIIAVVHMTLGVFIKATNTLHYKKLIDFFFEFVPQLLFLVLLFGYMDFLIIFKWLTDWGLDSPTAPSIITTMINMPLKLGATTDCCGGQPMWGTYGDTSQDTIQLWFFIVAVICVPLMLLPKPLYLIYCQRQQQKLVEQEQHDRTGRLLGSGQSIDSLDTGHSHKKGEHHDSSEIFVHQLIQTIEYVLGCISNTASYLRLWALSLAHSQLSEVFFDKLIEGSLVSGFSGIPMMIIGFVFLAGITFGVLLCMDAMECFLHTLRLHWVEFNNKFYKGSGYSFVFYSFKKKITEQLALQS